MNLDDQTQPDSIINDIQLEIDELKLDYMLENDPLKRTQIKTAIDKRIEYLLNDYGIEYNADRE